LATNNEHREIKAQEYRACYFQKERIRTHAECSCKYIAQGCPPQKRKVCVQAGLCVDSFSSSVIRTLMSQEYFKGKDDNKELRTHAAAFYVGTSEEELDKHRKALKTCVKVVPTFSLRIEVPEDLPKEAPKKKQKKGRKLELDDV